MNIEQFRQVLLTQLDSQCYYLKGWPESLYEMKQSLIRKIEWEIEWRSQDGYIEKKEKKNND